MLSPRSSGERAPKAGSQHADHAQPLVDQDLFVVGFDDGAIAVGGPLVQIEADGIVVDVRPLSELNELVR